MTKGRPCLSPPGNCATTQQQRAPGGFTNHLSNSTYTRTCDCRVCRCEATPHCAVGALLGCSASPRPRPRQRRPPT